MGKDTLSNCHKKGFTIIEVVLVLAIAGLIFAMVFIALPALQRTQRNSQRKRNGERFYSAVQKYYANNRKLPFYIKYTTNADGTRNYRGQGNTLDTKFVMRYIDENCPEGIRSGESEYGDQWYTFYDNGAKSCGESFRDPDGSVYGIVVLNGNGSGYRYEEVDQVNHFILFAAGSRCDEENGEGTRAATGNSNDFLLFVPLEGAQRYCIDSTSSR